MWPCQCQRSKPWSKTYSCTVLLAMTVVRLAPACRHVSCQVRCIEQLLSMRGAWQERNIAETGLNLLLEMLIMFERSVHATVFHQQYYLMLVREIFVVMTGRHPLLLCHARYSPALPRTSQQMGFAYLSWCVSSGHAFHQVQRQDTVVLPR